MNIAYAKTEKQLYFLKSFTGVKLYVTIPTAPKSPQKSALGVIESEFIFPCVVIKKVPISAHIKDINSIFVGNLKFLIQTYITRKEIPRYCNTVAVGEFE